MSRRKDGKMDRRTTEYREAAERMAAARAAMTKERAGSKPAGTRRADGRLDQRTREGRDVAARMEAMRAKRGRGKGFFAWLFGG